MTIPASPATPPLRDVLREQVRAVAFTLRTPALVTAALLVVGTGAIALEFFRNGRGFDFAPESSMMPGMVGLLFPIVVWLGEERFGPGFLRTLPVEHRSHLLARTAAGWLCLVGVVATFVLWQLVVALATGGNVGATETVQLLPDLETAPARLDPASLRPVRWTPIPLLWLVPFTAATATYLLASALALAVRHPLRWIVGTLLGLFLVVGTVSELALTAGARDAALAPSRVLDSMLFGRFGIDALFTARVESLHTSVTLTTGDVVTGWRALPDVGDWVAATLCWMAIALLALWAASARHRERYRA